MEVKIGVPNIRTWIDLVDDDTGLDSVNCQVEYSNDGVSYVVLAASIPNINLYSWTPNEITDTAYLRITGIGGTPSIIIIGPIKVSLTGGAMSSDQTRLIYVKSGKTDLTRRINISSTNIDQAFSVSVSNVQTDQTLDVFEETQSDQSINVQIV
jgi:hypothetical protein